jgi:hypothetical protein
VSPKKPKKAAPPPPPVRKAPPRPTTGSKPKDAKREQAHKAARRQALRKRLIAAGLVAAVAAAIVGYVNYDRQKEAELREALTSGSCTTDREADPTRPAGQNHVPNPTYAVNPPSAGDHLVANASSGVYAGADVPTDGLLVHSLEHGYVIYWHDAELPEEQKSTLERLERRFPGDIIVAERAGMSTPVAATAWGQRILCGEAEEEPLARFAQEYIGKGPEQVPRG